MEEDTKRVGVPPAQVSAPDDPGTPEALRSLIVGPDRLTLQELRERRDRLAVHHTIARTGAGVEGLYLGSAGAIVRDQTPVYPPSVG